MTRDPTLIFLAGCVVLCLAVVGAVAIVSGLFVEPSRTRAAFRARCADEGGTLITSMTSTGLEAYVCQPPGTRCHVVFREEGRPPR